MAEPLTPPTAEDLARDLREDLIGLDHVWSDLSLAALAAAACRRAIAAEARVKALEDALRPFVDGGAFRILRFQDGDEVVAAPGSVSKAREVLDG